MGNKLVEKSPKHQSNYQKDDCSFSNITIANVEKAFAKIDSNNTYF